MIVTQDIEMTASCEYSDVVLPATSWIEFQALEITNSCSNPFLQIWGRDGIKPLYDNRDDLRIMTGVAEKLAELLEDRRFRDYPRHDTQGFHGKDPFAHSHQGDLDHQRQPDQQRQVGL